MNHKTTITLTSTCIITSITCVALTFWGQIKNNGTITTDSYIGIIASLIGVCATIIVGFQIVSFFELRDLKRQVDQVKRQRKDLDSYKATIANEIHLSKTGISNAFGILSVVEKRSLLGFSARVSSIVCDDLQTTPGTILLSRYKQLYEETSFFLKTNDYIDAMHPMIENLKYIHIPQNKEYYYEIMKLHFDIITMMEKAKQESTKQ
ncbi:hypothetical protein [Odoribacter lunatus]|uniref:hypothetical protein n=1 Tax=Odoribacter lunatus TaxID=2941335 RepID=UPI00203C6A9C|nr:hypothetical protein [Odoribacter lunatus]